MTRQDIITDIIDTIITHRRAYEYIFGIELLGGRTRGLLGLLVLGAYSE